MPFLTVATCTHNPRPESLRRVLHALRSQDLPLEHWEYLLIDNASDTPVRDRFDLSWHPNARHLHESELGVTPARLHAIREARGDLLIFFDDDNLPAPDYLSTARTLATEHPHVGAFGGRLLGEFETPIPAHLAHLSSKLAVIDVHRDVQSNLYTSHTTPPGAGLVVRRAVAHAYHAKETANTGPRLDRQGDSLLSGGDIDLAWTAIDLGLLTARFTALSLTHLIPKERVQPAYLARISAHISYSGQLLHASRGLPHTLDHPRSRGLKRLAGDALTYLTQGSFALQRRRAFNALLDRHPHPHPRS